MSIDNIEDALNQLCVTRTSLGDQGRRALDEEGYLVLQGVVKPRVLEQLRAAFEKAAGEQAGGQGKETGGRKETGTRHPGKFPSLCAAIVRERGIVLPGCSLLLGE